MTQETRLVDLLSFTRDGEWGNSEPSDGHSPALVVRGTDFSEVRAGNLATLPLRYIRSDILARKAIVAGDTLIETAGGTKDQPTGRSVFIPNLIVDRAEFPLICASFARFLRPNPDRVDPNFLFWKLQDEYESRRMFPYHVQHTGVARFQYTQFAETHPFSLPDLPEQRAIASVLGALDDKIELNRRMNETLEAMARAIFKDWFVDFGPTRAKMEGRAPYLAPDIWSLFPDRLDDEGKPEGWTKAPLSALIEVNPSETLARGAPAPYLDMASIPTAGPNPDPYVTREFGSGMRFRNGDALLARITPCLENGKTAFVQNLPEGDVGWGSTEFIVLRAREPVPRAVSYLVARDPNFRANAIRSMTGTSGRQRASNDAIAAFALIRPADNSVWRALDSLIEPIFARIAANDRESLSLAAARDLLLPQLMSGKVRIKHAKKFLEVHQ